MSLTDKEKRYLLSLARKSIETYLRFGKVYEPSPSEVPSSKLVEDGAVFVTLYKNGELRGCIGSLEAHRPLFKDVIDNALNAAFNDPRFPPVSLNEMKDIKIEISYLTPPVEVKVRDWKELLEKLVPGKTGLIIQKGWARATFLPVVWKQIPKKEDFLSHLCIKAGLRPEEWKEPGMSFFFYEAEEFSEEEYE